MKTLVTTILAIVTLNVSADESILQIQAAQTAERQARDAAGQAMRQAQLEMERALDQHAQIMAQSVGGARRERVIGMPANRQIRTLVASPRLTDPKEIVPIEEDLAIMSRLLNKEVEREVSGGNDRAMGIFITSFGSGSRAPEAVYLEGFGAMFTLNVNFPLLPGTEEKAEKTEAAPLDSDWDKARAELFGGVTPDQPRHAQVTVMGMDNTPPAYDAEKVENLKSTVLAALRNAANIRVLKPDDFIHVAVMSGHRNEFIGGGGGFGAVASGHMSVTVTQDGKTTSKTIKSSGDAGRNSTLNIRVKRSDVDALANGKLTLEEFKKKAAITLY